MLERGRHMLSEEYFPAERQDQFIFRGQKASSSLAPLFPSE